MVFLNNIQIVLSSTLLKTSFKLLSSSPINYRFDLFFSSIAKPSN